MELNVIKIGKHRFELKVGDKFFTNGPSFAYSPSTEENQRKIPFGDYHRPTSISAKKWKKFVEKADNIEVDHNVKGWKSIYTVKYVYKEDKPQIEPIWFVSISLLKGVEAIELKVERETKELLFLDRHSSHPISYHSKVYKDKLGKITIEDDQWQYSNHLSRDEGQELVQGLVAHTLIYFDQYDETVDKLIMAMKDKMSKDIAKKNQELQLASNNYAKFDKFMETQGY